MKPGTPHPEPIRDAARLGLTLSPDQASRLGAFTELLRERAVPAGMVSRGDADRLYDRHVLDSLTAAAVFDAEDRTAFDLGSGAGLPGIVLAVALPEVRFVLVESRSRRAGFLELAAERLGLANVEVVAGRVEHLSDGADVATARAFAPLERTWPVARRLLRPGGRLIYFAGGGLEDPRRRAAEVAEAGGGAAEVRGVLDSSRTLVIIART